MLEKKNRLTKDNDFDKAFKFGKSTYTDILGVKAFKNGLEQNRFGIIVSTKISKKAVERNRVKRLIRESLKQEAKILSSNYDIVIITLPLILNKKLVDIVAAISICFKKIERS